MLLRPKLLNESLILLNPFSGSPEPILLRRTHLAKSTSPAPRATTATQPIVIPATCALVSCGDSFSAGAPAGADVPGVPGVPDVTGVVVLEAVGSMLGTELGRVLKVEV